MTLIHIPMSVVNGFTSMMRNMFITSSIGFAAMAFSNSFKKYKSYIKFIGYCIFIYSIIYGLTAATDFNRYLHVIENDSELGKEDKLLLDHWKNYDNLAYLYCVMLILFVLILLKRDFLP